MQGRGATSGGKGAGRGTARGARVAPLALLALALAPATRGEETGEEPQLLQELFLLETPYPQEERELQVDLSACFASADDADHLEVALGLEYGFSDRFQLGVSLPYRHRDSQPGSSADGVGDVAAELLYAFVRRDALLAALALEASFPSGDEDEELGEGRVEWEPSLRAGAALGRGWVYASIGAEASSREASLRYGGAFAHPLLPRVVGAVELTGSALGDERPIQLAPGVIARGPFGLELRLGVPVGLSSDAPGWGVVAASLVEF